MIALLVLDAAGALGLWFGYTIIQDKKTEETTLHEKITEVIQKRNREIGLGRTLAAVKDDRAELLKFLYDPSEDGQVQFVSQIEQLGTTTTKTLVETQSLVFIKQEPPSLRGDFTLKGPWDNIYYFLRLLEEFPSRLVINHFKVTHTSGEKIWTGTVQVDLKSLRINK